MKKLKNFFIRIATNYYSYMMSACVDNATFTRVMYGEESKDYQRWVKKYGYYSKRYKILTEE